MVFLLFYTYDMLVYNCYNFIRTYTVIEFLPVSMPHGIGICPLKSYPFSSPSLLWLSLSQSLVPQYFMYGIVRYVCSICINYFLQKHCTTLELFKRYRTVFVISSVTILLGLPGFSNIGISPELRYV